MVQLTLARLIRLNKQSVGPRPLRGPKYTARTVPLQYQNFQKRLIPEEIVEQHSRDEGDRVELQTRHGSLVYPGLSEADHARNQIFQDELDRQRAIVSRIEKIRVEIQSLPGNGTILMMNKNLSTPHDCARHINEMLVQRSVVAELFPANENPDNLPETNEQKDRETNIKQDSTGTLWDMHRPLNQNCVLKLRHFKEENVTEVNKAYWRSCSFLLGMAIKLAFKEGIKVMLHSWPRPNPASGSFVYDAALNLSDKWTPSEHELRAFTKILWDIKNAALPFQRLTASPDVAKQLFHDNSFKLMQIDSMLSGDQSQSGNLISIYRCGGHIDLSIGPMISNTSQIGRISVAAVHQFEPADISDEFKGIFYRFQGVSLPQQLPLNSFIYQNILLNRAKQLNTIQTH